MGKGFFFTRGVTIFLPPPTTLLDGTQVPQHQFDIELSGGRLCKN